MNICTSGRYVFNVVNILRAHCFQSVVLQVDRDRKRVYVKEKNADVLVRIPGHWFSIPEIPSFEKELEETQEELGIDPFDFVPVQFVESRGLVYVLCVT